MEAIQGPALAEAITVARLMSRHPMEAFTDSSLEVNSQVGRSVADLKHRLPLAIDEESSLARAAEMMAVHRVQFLPVTDVGGHVCGVISARDVLAWLAGL